MSLILVVFVAGCNSADNKIVATVNGENIYAKDLENYFTSAMAEMEQMGYGVDLNTTEGKEQGEMYKQRILEQTINHRLVAQEARKEVTLTDAQIKEKLDELKATFPTIAAFESTLAGYHGLSHEDYVYILVMQEGMAESVNITDAAARAFYEENKDNFFTNDQSAYVTRHVLFLVDTDGTGVNHADEEAKLLAEDVVARLKNGADIAAIASAETEDPGSKASGGLYRFSDNGNTVPEYVAAVKELRSGGFTQTPVKTMYGYHVIKLEEVIPAGVTPFSQEREAIISHLTETETQQLLNDKMMEVRALATINNILYPESDAGE
jgi:peptidyl-prolyl cis-trans isomerase C